MSTARSVMPARIDPPEAWLPALVHALRNGLGALCGAAEVLGLEGIDPAVRERARSIVAHKGNQLSRLADHLAAMTDEASGPPESPIDLAAIVRAALESERPTAVAAGQDLLHDVQSATVRGDGRELEQALRALLRRQLRALAPGGTLVVRMDACHGAARIQLLASASAQAAATFDDPDLGLALARHTVARHGGQLVFTQGARGHAIEVELPLARPGTHREPGARDASGAAGRRVVMVQSPEPGRAQLAGTLRDAGLDVVAPGDAAASLDCLLSAWPDAAVVELNAPDVAGLELARNARRRGYAGRMVAIATDAAAPGPEAARRHGFDAHLARPFTTAQLRAALAG